jgi:3-oxoacyl-[acyl-carrier-protein] synthase II
MEARAQGCRLAITGLGPLCAAGTGGEALWRSIAEGRTPVSFIEPQASGIASPPFPAYELDEGAAERLLAREELSGLPADPELRLSLAALRLAIEDAELEPRHIAGAALVATYESAGLDRLQREIFAALAAGAAGAPAGTAPAAPEALFLDFYRRFKDAFYHTQSFIHLHLLCRTLEIHGPTLFVNNACASGLHALEAAAELLRSAKADVALVVAAESPLFPTKKLWFEELGIYALDGRLRPFDRDRSGLVFGEAGAAVVLEPLGRALERGARVRAEYLGGFSNQEGWKVAVPNIAERYYEEAVRGACRAAGVTPGEIDLINAHGAGTHLSDLYEARGLTSVFGEWPGAPPIVALKPYFGHALGASALLEACALILALERRTLPATPGFATPDPRLKLAPAAGPRRADLRTALKMANGFAGFNAGAVFRRFDGFEGDDRP